jgi:hypothetical protein
MLPSERLRRSIADVPRAVNVAATVACLIFGGRATGHPEYAPSTVNHYVKFDLVAPGAMRIAYTVMVGPAPAAAWRRAADANGDGRIDEAESRAIGERARVAVAKGIALVVDGKAVTPEFDAPVVGMAGDTVAPSPLSVDLVAHVAMGGDSQHTVRFDDATVEPQIGETEVLVEESPTTRLVASHRGASGEEKQTRFLFRGAKFSVLEDRSITFVFEARLRPAPTPTPTQTPTTYLRRWGWVVVVLILVLLIGIRMGRRWTGGSP